MHRPEMWGYVQFSTKPGASFVPDASWPARAFLYDVYYAQRAFKQARGRYAGTLAELGMSVPADRGLQSSSLVSDAADRYTVSVALAGGGGREVWHTNQESAI